MLSLWHRLKVKRYFQCDKANKEEMEIVFLLLYLVCPCALTQRGFFVRAVSQDEGFWVFFSLKSALTIMLYFVLDPYCCSCNFTWYQVKQIWSQFFRKWKYYSFSRKYCLDYINMRRMLSLALKLKVPEQKHPSRYMMQSVLAQPIHLSKLWTAESRFFFYNGKMLHKPMQSKLLVFFFFLLFVSHLKFVAYSFFITFLQT